MKTPIVNNPSNPSTSSIPDVPTNLPPIENRVVRTVEMVVEDTIKQIQQEHFQKNGTTTSGSRNAKQLSQKDFGEDVIKALLKAEEVIRVPKDAVENNALIPSGMEEELKPYLNGYILLLENEMDLQDVVASYPKDEQAKCLLALMKIGLANYGGDDNEAHSEIVALCDEFLAKKMVETFPKGISKHELSVSKSILDSARTIIESDGMNPIEYSTSVLLELAIATCPSPIIENIDDHTKIKNFMGLYADLFTTLRTNLLSSIPQEELATLLHLLPCLKTVELDAPSKDFIPFTKSVTRLTIKNNCDITDEVIAKLDLATRAPQLQLLNLSSTNVSLENIKLPVALTEVHLNDCVKFTDTSLNCLLQQLPFLKRLSIARTRVTFSEQQPIRPHLERLCLDGLHIENGKTFSSSLPIKGGLELLSLNDTRMPEEVQLPEKITDLFIRGNKITNKQLSIMMQGLNRLSALDLTDSPIDLEGIHLPATLTILVVCGTAVTATTLNKALKGCKDLVEVDISGTQVEPEELEIEDKRKIRKETIQGEIPVLPTQESAIIQSNQLDDDVAE